VGVGAAGAVPIGIVAGIYLSEFHGSKFASIVRFSADTLNGVPSIVIGLFAYTIFVLPVHHFSALAGGAALGVMMLPIITRTTEELLRLVPMALREGAYALGATRSKAMFTVVLPAALPGILTGVILALARTAGETAPLIFTALNNQFWPTSLTKPMASLTVQVYTYALTAYDDLHRQAWAGALVLVMIVFFCSLLARVATRRLERMHTGH
jgi:phosphate transport system permease protein